MKQACAHVCWLMMMMMMMIDHVYPPPTTAKFFAALCHSFPTATSDAGVFLIILQSRELKAREVSTARPRS